MSCELIEIPSEFRETLIPRNDRVVDGHLGAWYKLRRVLSRSYDSRIRWKRRRFRGKQPVRRYCERLIARYSRDIGKIFRLQATLFG